MRVVLPLVALALCLCPRVSAGQATRRPDGASVEKRTELLRWVSAAVADYGDRKRKTGDARSRLEFQECRATLVQRVRSPGSRSALGNWPDTYWIDSTQFDLENVDEVAGFIYGGEAPDPPIPFDKETYPFFSGVSLTSADGLRSFRVIRIDLDVNGLTRMRISEHRASSLDIPLEAQALRIRGALKRAVLLCGGGHTRAP